MSRLASAGRRAVGGELVDCGNWNNATPAAPTPAAGTKDTNHTHTNRTTKHVHSGVVVASHWLNSEPVTVGVDHVSDRPLYCLSVNLSNHSFVTGGGDHSLRVYDFKTGSLRRELYSKTSGHTEWVTTCATLPDGRVFSGGMDGKVLLWGSSGTRSQELLGHGASISKVMVDKREIGLSASYDKSIKVWSLGTRAPKDLLTIKCGTTPLTCMDWNGSLVTSGSREGMIGLWDINTGQNVRTIKSNGGGQLLTLQFGSIEIGRSAQDASNEIDGGGGVSCDSSWLLVSGGSDGCLRIYDLRTEECIFQKRLSSGNPGSVNDVAFGVGQLVTALADGVCTVLDARQGFVTSKVLSGHRAPVQCVKIAPNNSNVVCSAASNGWLMVHDIGADGVAGSGSGGANGATRLDAAYAMGLTTQGGINAMWVGETSVIAAGDDGQPVILQY